MKDPAFLFYSKDFLTGVADLTFEERGQYITLMALQHQKGHLTKKLIDISVPNVSEDVLSKFSIDSDGNYFNERLELESEKRAEHSRKQKERAIKGWEKRKRQSQGAATADAAALPLVNADANVDVNEINSFTIPTLIEVEKYFNQNGYTIESARKFFKYYETSRGEKGRVWKDSSGKTVKNWKQKAQSVWFKPENKKERIPL